MYVCMYAYRHAAVRLVPVLPVQLHRFESLGHKVVDTVVLSPKVQVPLYSTEGLQTTSQAYQLGGVIHHLGVGHYRTVLFHQGRMHAVSDANTTPQSIGASEQTLWQRTATCCFSGNFDVVPSNEAFKFDALSLLIAQRASAPGEHLFSSFLLWVTVSFHT